MPRRSPREKEPNSDDGHQRVALFFGTQTGTAEGFAKSVNDAPKSGNNGVLKSFVGGITLIGAVFFIAHLRKSKGTSFTAILPSLSEKSVQSDSRVKNVDNSKTTEVLPAAN